MNKAQQFGAYLQPPDASYKVITGPCQVKLFCTGKEEPLYPVGSGTLFTIENRTFIITCWHVVRVATMEHNVVFYEPTPDDKIRPIRSNNIYVFENEDIALLEIYPSYTRYLRNKQSVTLEFINTEVSAHLQAVSTVILHAVPYETLEFSIERKEITLNTFPYVTFAKGIKNDFIEIDINRTGINELGEKAIVPDIGGMSGSGVWTFHPEDKILYRLAGILTNGDTDSGIVYALDINFVIDLLQKALKGQADQSQKSG